MHLIAAELAAHVRAGRTLSQAIADVADELPEPSRSELARVDRALSVGLPVGEALALLDGGDDAVVLAAAVSLQLRFGGDLPALLDGIAEALLERDALRRSAQVATAQACATARMVAGMAPVAVLLLGVVDRPALMSLLGSPFGLLSLAASAGLTVAGLALATRIASVAP